jgi:hypothetical protein
MSKIALKSTNLEEISNKFVENHKTQVIETTIDNIKIVVLETIGNTKIFACKEKD